jgi:hypothetical protein
MLPQNQRQEALSRAYVRAVAAKAGVICVETVQDLGIDLFLRAVERHGSSYRDTGPQIDVQLKSTTRADVREAEIAYDLEVRAYELLRMNVPGCPRLLVVLVLPDDVAQWLSQSPDELILRRCAYWLSLRGAGPTPNQTTIRLAIPPANVFSVEAVQEMMKTLKAGGEL